MTFHEEKLSSERHFMSVGDFSCGPDSPLDIFLSSNAFKYDEQRYGITYVLTPSNESDEILGFYTLKASGIQIYENDEYNSIPVIEIARIALHHELQGKGFGKYVFYTHILPKVNDVAEKVAVKAIIAFVEPKDEQAIGFYKSVGFEKASECVQKEIEDSFNEECDLYMVSLNEIETHDNQEIATIGNVEN